MRDKLKNAVLNIKESTFEKTALAVFRYQAGANPVYAEYLRLLSIDPIKVQSLYQIPFLPIQFFKTHIIRTGDWTSSTVFSSSGTTGSQTSRHELRDGSFYKHISQLGSQFFYQNVSQYCVLALLPSYLERQGSSLVYMVEHFINQSKYVESGFFLKDTEKLLTRLTYCKDNNIPTLLIGVSFALLDLAEASPKDLRGVIVMETGGMKGRRKEITREELHKKLSQAFQLDSIHSEYGMTELFSQAYSKGNGIFYPSPTLRAFVREISDPFSIQKLEKTGVLNLIDLGNLDTCSFIATDDLSKMYADGSFEILGRLDNSDLRGCNLMLSEL